MATKAYLVLKELTEPKEETQECGRDIVSVGLNILLIHARSHLYLLSPSRGMRIQ